MSLGPGPLDLAFIGCGLATRMHTRTLRRLDPTVRRHYASRSAERARACAAESEGAGAFGSYGEALESPEVDVVLIATPPASHLELALRALAAGKHVIVEKPAFLEPDAVDRAAEAAERSGRRVLVAENYAYKPLLARLRELLAAGAVGEPLLVVLNAVKEQDAAGWRADPGEVGGGALLEGGIHWIHFLAELLTPPGAEPPALSVRGVRADGMRGAEAHAAPERGMVVALGSDGGPAAVLLYSWQVPSPLRGLRVSRIYGREGSIAFETNGVCVLVWGRRKRLGFPGFRDISGHRPMFADFLETLRTGKEPRMSLGKARRDLELVRAVYRSAGREDSIAGAAVHATGR